MDDRKSLSGRTVLVLAAIALVLAGMKAAAEIVVPFLLAVFIATLTWPLVLWLHRHKVPKIVAILIVVAVVVGFLTLIGGVTANVIQAFNQNLPVYRDRLESQLDPLETWLNDLFARFGMDTFPSEFQAFRDNLQLKDTLGFAGNTLVQFGNVLTKVFLAMLAVLFMLLEAFQLPAKVTRALGPAERTWASFETFAQTVQKYPRNQDRDEPADRSRGRPLGMVARYRLRGLLGHAGLPSELRSKHRFNRRRDSGRTHGARAAWPCYRARRGGRVHRHQRARRGTARASGYGRRCRAVAVGRAHVAGVLGLVARRRRHAAGNTAHDQCENRS